MPSTFDKAFDWLMEVEGGYVNDSRDLGGETKYGISKLAYPNEDIAGLTLERAKALYRRDYWEAIRGDELPTPVALVVFDTAVNCGLSRATKWLQVAAGAKPDGTIGPLTMAKVKAAQPLAMVVDLLTLRNLHNASLKNWDTYGKGWSRRLFNLALRSMVGG